MIIIHQTVDYHPSYFGIEVKASTTLHGNDVRGLQALATAAGKHWLRGVVLYTGTEVVPFAANLHGVPLSRLWSE
jgi:hypothetical protein